MKALKFLSIVLISVGLIFAGCSKKMPIEFESNFKNLEGSLAKKGNLGGITIQDGILTYNVGHYLAGEPLKTGYDIYGYNYQAHLFNGYYANVYLGGEGFPPYNGDTDSYLAENPGAETKWYWPYRDVKLEMKWNDAWLSNMDCDGDGKLDRNYGSSSYIGSGAWLTNHQSGTNDDGTKWTDFVKIVAVPADAKSISGTWYTTDNKEIGPSIWGSFAIIQEIYNDPMAGAHGKEYLSPAAPGFGKYKP